VRRQDHGSDDGQADAPGGVDPWLQRGKHRPSGYHQEERPDDGNGKDRHQPGAGQAGGEEGEGNGQATAGGGHGCG
jgi:hypothetical protein